MWLSPMCRLTCQGQCPTAASWPPITRPEYTGRPHTEEKGLNVLKVELTILNIVAREVFLVGGGGKNSGKIQGKSNQMGKRVKRERDW